jgi:hypothetical protein
MQRHTPRRISPNPAWAAHLMREAQIKGERRFVLVELQAPPARPLRRSRVSYNKQIAGPGVGLLVKRGGQVRVLAPGEGQELLADGSVDHVLALLRQVLHQHVLRRKAHAAVAPADGGANLLCVVEDEFGVLRREHLDRVHTRGAPAVGTRLLGSLRVELDGRGHGGHKDGGTHPPCDAGHAWAIRGEAGRHAITSAGIHPAGRGSAGRRRKLAQPSPRIQEVIRPPQRRHQTDTCLGPGSIPASLAHRLGRAGNLQAQGSPFWEKLPAPSTRRLSMTARMLYEPEVAIRSSRQSFWDLLPVPSAFRLRRQGCRQVSGPRRSAAGSARDAAAGSVHAPEQEPAHAEPPPRSAAAGLSSPARAVLGSGLLASEAVEFPSQGEPGPSPK